jgi:hypothetical protein
VKAEPETKVKQRSKDKPGRVYIEGSSAVSEDKPNQTVYHILHKFRQVDTGLVTRCTSQLMGMVLWVLT